jgi:hypothetical protein
MRISYTSFWSTPKWLLDSETMCSKHGRNCVRTNCMVRGYIKVLGKRRKEVVKNEREPNTSD